MCTLENSAASQAKQAKILEESLKRATIRETCMIEASKKGKIFIKDFNKAYHIMQPKHAWDKIIKITGNVEEDFKTLLLLLEEQGVISHQNSKKIFKVADGVVRREHEKIISNHVVKIIFNEYTETGEIFLNDAWVITK